MNKAKALGGLASILAGVGLGKKVYDKRSSLTGREHMFHDTASKNVPSILEQGLLASKANNPENFTNLKVKSIPKAEKKNKVYLAKNKLVADEFGGMISTNKEFSDPRSTLNINIPTWKFKEVDNPLTKYFTESVKEGKRVVQENKKDKAKFALKINKEVLKQNKKRLNYWGPKGTTVIEGDVGPEYIKESPHYKKLSVSEIKDYIKNNPGKFAKGALGVAGSLGLMAGGGGLLRSALKKTASKGDDNMNKVAMYKEEIVKMAMDIGAPGSPRAKAYQKAIETNTELPPDFDILDDGMVDRAQAKRNTLGALAIGAGGTAGGFLGAKHLKPKLRGGIAGAAIGAGIPFAAALELDRRRKKKEKNY